METEIKAGTFADHPLAPRVGAAAGGSSARRPTLGATMNTLDWRQALGGAMLAIGTLAILIAWWQISGTPHPGEQMPPLASGGFGGAALIAVGVLLLNSFEHVKDREALGEVMARLEALDERAQQVDGRIVDQLDELRAAWADLEEREQSRPPRRATRSASR